MVRPLFADAIITGLAGVAISDYLSPSSDEDLFDLVVQELALAGFINERAGRAL